MSFILLSFILLQLMGIIQCGTGASTSIAYFTGVVFKGPVKNGTLLIRPLSAEGETGTVIETIRTNRDGAFTFSTPIKQFPLYIQAVDGHFIDESGGKKILLSEQQSLACILHTGSTDETTKIYITPLTTLSTKLARSLIAHHEETDDAIKNSEKIIENLFELPQMLSISPSDLTDPVPDTPDSKNALYALIIAGLSEEAKQLSDLHGDPSIDVMTLVEALSEDISDGALDGKKVLNKKEELLSLGEKQIPLPAEAMTKELALAMKAFLKNPNNRSGLKETNTAIEKLTDKIKNNKRMMMPLTVSPAHASVVLGLNKTLSFQTKMTGLKQSAVTWSVNDITGGNDEIGTIDSDGLYHSPQTMPAAGETIAVRATSSIFPQIYGEAEVQLKQAISLSPTKTALQIGAEQLFEAQVHAEGTPIEWLVNDIPGGNETVGKIRPTTDLKALYQAPKIIPPVSVIRVHARTLDNHAFESEAKVSLFETKAALRYEGFLHDKVSDRETPVSGNGLDAVFQLTLDNGGDFTDAIAEMSLGDGSGTMGWDTVPQNGIYLIGASENPGSPLLNQSDGSVDISFQNKKNVYLYVDDSIQQILSGGDYQLNLNLKSGRKISLLFTLKRTLLIHQETPLSGKQPLYGFIGIQSTGHLKAFGDMPLELFSEGNILISGKISADGQAGQDGGLKSGDGGKGGPGSSEGGSGGKGTGQKGKGLGGGKNIKEDNLLTGGGGGGFGTPGKDGNNGGGGQTYGSAELTPLIGGSGGAGGRYQGNDLKNNNGGGGGGGGGAIGLNAARDITISGTVKADGGNGGGSGSSSGSGGGGGSGGGILIHSDTGTILLEESGKITAQGGQAGKLGGGGGKGRVHIEGRFIQQGLTDPPPQ